MRAGQLCQAAQAEMGSRPTVKRKQMKLYRFLSAPEGFAFNQRVSLALQEGWEPFGNPVMTYDPVLKVMIAGQAIVKETEDTDDIDVVSLLEVRDEPPSANRK